MADLYLTKADEKNATLKLRLKAKSGYNCEANYRVSANQWAAIIVICEETREQPR